MNRISFSILLGLLLCIAPSVQAQVTIGSGTEPNPGALLDFKEQDVINGVANSTKGLGMPRVKLTDKSKLQPMYSYADATAANTPDATALAAHTGLMVYNIDQCTLQGKGLYVWDGTQWQVLGQEAVTLEGMVKKLGTAQDAIATNGVAWHKDHEGNIFFSMNYDAANPTGNTNRWMTTNLATKTYDVRTANTAWGTDGKPNLTNNYVASGSTNVHYDIAYWLYPNPNETSIISHLSTTYDARPRLGLLYNYAAATGNQNPSIVNQGHQDQLNPDEIANNKGVQGICPTGWHIPTDKEWTELETEIKANAPIYSGSEVNTDKLSYAMMDMCEGNTKQFYSNLVLNRGFSVLLTGAVDSGVYELFGQASLHWCSSSFNDIRAYTRYFIASDPNVVENHYDRNMLISVRCKKD